MPKSFKSFVEKKGLKTIIFKLEIDDNDQDATLYLVTNGTKEKIMRFRNKIPTAEEKKNNEYTYATEVVYFIP
jgi:DNA-directed RNA polymerase beta subunit